MTNLTANITLGLNDKISGPARKITQALKHIGITKGQFKDVGKAIDKFSNNLKKSTREAGLLAGKLTVLGGAGLIFVKSQLVDTAAEFEKFKTVLETLEGSSSKAKSSMDWVSDFAAKTPFELDQVMESFVKLRSYGIDPVNGLLETLGDTASAMGKPIIQSVEAIADAMTGENERLKEFGITSETRGNQTRYSYTDKEGEQRYKIVDKNNRKIVQSTLMTIWNEKYGGAMEKQSKSWIGMISNISDQWTRFKIAIMDGGLFDWMKTKLSGILELLNRMAADGSLDKLAANIGEKLKRAFEISWKAGKVLMQCLKGLGRAVSWLADVMGGYENLAMGVAVLMGGKLLVSVTSLAGSFITLGKTAVPIFTTALKTLSPTLTPIATSAAGLASSLAAIAAGAAALGIVNNVAGKAATDYHLKNSSTDALLRERSALKSLVPYDVPPIPNSGTEAIDAELNRRGFKGELKITVAQEGKFKVEKLESTPGFDIDVDAGRMMLWGY